jgi:hypothetical protein
MLDHLPRRPADPDAAIVRERLARQRLAGARDASLDEPPADLVRWFGAVQAQDYPAALWAIGLRLPGCGQAEVEAAIEARRIVRTWPMRRTLHFVPAEDVRWMLRLLASRVISASAGRYRQLGLVEADFTRGARILSRALRAGGRLTRAEAYAVLARGGVDPSGQRGIHVLAHLAQRGLLCFGPRRERQHTFVLLEEWLPAASEPDDEEALARLATRYFTSHGPATVRDFAWWTGLPLRDVRRAVEAAGPALQGAGADLLSGSAPAPRRARVRRAPAAALLPPWDEYLVAYRDRSFAARRLSRPAGVALIGKPLIVVDGQVRGCWRRSATDDNVRLTLEPWTPLAERERRAVGRVVERYRRFVGKQVSLAEPPPS